MIKLTFNDFLEQMHRDRLQRAVGYRINAYRRQHHDTPLSPTDMLALQCIMSDVDFLGHTRSLNGRGDALDLMLVHQQFIDTVIEMVEGQTVTDNG